MGNETSILKRFIEDSNLPPEPSEAPSRRHNRASVSLCDLDKKKMILGPLASARDHRSGAAQRTDQGKEEGRKEKETLNKD